MKKWKADKNTGWIQCPYCKSYDIVEIVMDDEGHTELLCLNCGKTEKGDDLYPIAYRYEKELKELGK